MNPHDMTDDQLRVRVATLLGWNSIYYEGGKMCGCLGTDLETTMPVPDWPVDLNASNEMARTIPMYLETAFINRLVDIVERDGNARSMLFGTMAASARQWCEAFVGTMEDA